LSIKDLGSNGEKWLMQYGWIGGRSEDRPHGRGEERDHKAYRLKIER